jgi:hypothetical protein
MSGCLEGAYAAAAKNRRGLCCAEDGMLLAVEKRETMQEMVSRFSIYDSLLTANTRFSAGKICGAVGIRWP